MSYSGNKYSCGGFWLRMMPPFQFLTVAGNDFHILHFSIDAPFLFYLFILNNCKHP